MKDRYVSKRGLIIIEGGDLRLLYIEKSMSTQEVANYLGVAKSTISKALTSLNIRKTRIDGITKDMLTDMYINKNMRREDIAVELGVTERLIQRRLKEFDIRKTPDQWLANTRKTSMARYGVDNAGSIKSSRDKAKATSVSRYGVEYSLQNADILKKAQATNLKRYGYKTPAKNSAVQKKMEDTNIARYGAKNAFSSKDIQLKIQNTNKIKYGTQYASQSKQVKDKIRESSLAKYGVPCVLQAPEVIEKIMATNNKKYNVDSPRQRHILHYDEWVHRDRFKLVMQKLMSTRKLVEYFGVTNSKVLLKIHNYNLDDIFSEFEYPYTNKYETEIGNILDGLGIEYSTNNRYELSGKEIDFYIKSLKVGIEFNGDYWHQSSVPTRTGNIKSKLYHYNKSVLALERGIRIYHIFEYEWLSNKEAIINQLKNLLHVEKTRIFARKTIVREISSSIKNDFLIKNHRQGKDLSKIKLGLFSGDKLVSVMTFRKPLQGDCEIELSRYCSDSNIQVVGGASKLFRYFINNYGYTSVLSYQDIARTSGDLYKILGFRLDHVSEPNYVWADMCTGNYLTRYQTRMKNEKQIMIERGYVQIFDCGNKVWIYKR